MPNMDGLEAIEEIVAEDPEAHILAKPHLANRTQAALFALREGLAPLDGSDSP